MRFNRYSAVGLVVIFACTSAAMGSLLPSDSNAMPGWKGDQNFYFQLGGGHPNTLDVNVDYAVYAPGKFDSTFGTADPSNGTQYVYAYQFFDVLPGTVGVTAFSVGQEPGALSQDIGSVLAPDNSGGTPYSNAAFNPGGNPTSAIWSFSSPNVPVGGNSSVLIYTSPYGPGMQSSSVQGAAALIASASLPSPVPEPATGALLAIAATFLLSVRFYRRATKLV